VNAPRNGRPRRARLAAVGAYAPERVVTNADLERTVDTSDAWIVARTGIRERRVAGPEHLGADGSGWDTLILPAGGGRRPVSTGPEPHEGYIHMNGPEVFRFATRILVESAERLLRSLEMSVHEVDLLVAHQANSRIIEHAARRLGIPEERIFNNIDRYGNTSAASIPLALAGARDAGRLHPGDLLLLVGFGGGLTWASTIVRYEPLGMTA
jgi:3-oxoacyl-[acyl-carrier-protein] synthase III